MDELRELISMLRESGVTRYEGTFQGGLVILELGKAPDKVPPLDLAAEVRGVRTGRSPELKAALARLDPHYADPTLFEINEVAR